ncbi:hypothetical protein ACFLVJ_02800, partial [Chloroflexota bacterium]
FGPSDYARSIGLAKVKGVKPEDMPEVKAAFNTMLDKALKKGVRPRLMLHHHKEVRSGRSPEEFVKMGVKDFNCGIDIETLEEFYEVDGEQMEKLLGIRR